MLAGHNALLLRHIARDILHSLSHRHVMVFDMSSKSEEWTGKFTDWKVFHGDKP